MYKANLNILSPVIYSAISFAAGCWLYFKFTQEPNLILLSIISTIGILLSIISIRKFWKYSQFVIFISIFSFGVLWATYKTSFHEYNVIKQTDKTIWVRATVEKIEPFQKYTRITLNNLDLWQKETGKLTAKKTPVKVRVNIRTKIPEELKPGDRISFRGKLSLPPSKPVYPGGYDFGRYAFFEQIGAIGFSFSDIKIYKSGSASFIENIRHKITTNIWNQISNNESTKHIATALITGQRSGIPKKNLENFRQSGLGHLLAISGLHMAMIMAGSFFVIRLILSIIPYFCLNYNIKKWAAYAALITGLFYLGISGSPISAQRAYIMASMFFIAIILDRSTSPLIPIAWAAIIILLISPYAIVSPSFHLSFAAVICLVAVYEMLNSRKNYSKWQEKGFINKFFIYAGAITFSSFLAGIATSPYAIEHFGRYAQYGILANLVGIPLATFFIMPMGVLGLILMPIGLESIPLSAMGIGINILENYAEWIVSIPNSSGSLPNISPYTMPLITIGGLGFCILRGKTQFAALGIWCTGWLGIFFAPVTADILISGDGDLFAVKDEDRYIYSSFQKGRYERSRWQQHLGEPKATTIKKASQNITIKCDDIGCEYRDGEAFISLKSNIENKIDCLKYKLVITLDANQSDFCLSQPHNYIDKDTLKKNGSYVVYLRDKIKIINVVELQGNRPWTQHFSNNNI